MVNIIDLPRRWRVAAHRTCTQEEAVGGGPGGEGGRPFLRQRLWCAEEGQQKFSSEKCSQKSQKGHKIFINLPKKGQQNSPSAPISRLKSKTFTSNLPKKVCPRTKIPGDAYAPDVPNLRQHMCQNGPKSSLGPFWLDGLLTPT